MGLSSTHALPLFCHAPQRPLELAEPVFGSLRGCTLHDRTAHQRFLQRDALLDFGSDRIPGLAGMGRQGAAALLRRYGTLEGAIKAGRLTAQAEMLRLYRSIATMNNSAPLPALRSRKPTGERPRTLPAIGS